MSIQTFSGEPVALLNGASSFQRQMKHLFDLSLAVRSSNAQPMRTHIRAYCGRRLRFAALRFSPHYTARGRQSNGSSRLLVTIMKEGRALASQAGRECRLKPGDILLLDLKEAFHIETSEILTHSIYFEPGPLNELVPQIAGLTGLAIDGKRGAGALFRSVVDELFSLASSIDEELADRTAAMLPYVLATALTSLPEANISMPSASKLMQKQRMRDFALTHLRDPELSPDYIAASLNLSKRYIYDVHAGEPLSLMKWVWTERLARCHKELGMAALKRRPIGEIARSWGFTDVAHFSRVFRERYGVTAREHRIRSIQRNDTQVG